MIPHQKKLLVVLCWENITNLISWILPYLLAIDAQTPGVQCWCGNCGKKVMFWLIEKQKCHIGTILANKIYKSPFSLQLLKFSIKNNWISFIRGHWIAYFPKKMVDLKQSGLCIGIMHWDNALEHCKIGIIFFWINLN